MATADRRDPMARGWKPEAGNFNDFKKAIKDALDEKPDGSEWRVEIEVKKKGNPVHEYRIVLRQI
jgi:hypothetical protein